ncbi:MAG: helix-turn-helix domain-containing protein [Thermoanaerobaculia bacterium]
MAGKGNPGVPALVVIFLRSYAGLTQAELGRASGIDQGDISRYELGYQVPSEDNLRRLAEAVDFPGPWLIHMRRYFDTLVQAIEHHREPAEAPLEDRLREAMSLALAPYLSELLEAAAAAEPSEEERRAEAEEIWQRLRDLPMETIRRLLVLAPDSGRGPALAELIRATSREVEAERPDKARELEELAVWVSRGEPG